MYEKNDIKKNLYANKSSNQCTVSEEKLKKKSSQKASRTK